MRLITNRTRNSISRPLRILSLLRSQWDGQRAPALQALADIGHEVIYVDDILPEGDYLKIVSRLDVDVAVLWGNSLQNFLLSSEGPFWMDEVGLPYVSMWTDNPIKHVYLLQRLDTSNHRGLFIADTLVIEQMAGLGYHNLFYLPPWHIDPEIFRPVEPDPLCVCRVSFAATVNSLSAEREKWRQGWSPDMHAAADRVMQQVQDSGDHIDVFEAIGAAWDAEADAFNKISHAMYFEQKALMRELVIHAVGERALHITGIGLAALSRENIIMHEGRDWHDLSPVFCAATVNLNATPWPRSCHHRVFQTTASRALSVTDWRKDSLALYEPDKEVVYFESLDALPSILDRFSTHPEEAVPIAEAGYRRFLAHHTVSHRMAELSALLYELL